MDICTSATCLEDQKKNVKSQIMSKYLVAFEAYLKDLGNILIGWAVGWGMGQPSSLWIGA